MKNIILNLKDYEITDDGLVHKKTAELIRYGIQKDKKSPFYGKEIPDPRPMRARVKITPKLTEAQRIQAQVAASLRAHNIQVDDEYTESFAEAEDFDIPGEPPEPSSPWEENFDNLSHNHHELVADQEVQLGVRKPGHKPSEVESKLQKDFELQQQTQKDIERQEQQRRRDQNTDEHLGVKPKESSQNSSESD